MLIPKNDYERLKDIPWTLIKDNYCLKYVFENQGYLLLITDLRLVWFEHTTGQKIKTIASRHSIEIETKQDTIRLLSRLESLFRQNLEHFTVQRTLGRVQIHCQEQPNQKLNVLSWTFECDLLDQTGEGYTGPDILYQGFMLPSLSMAHHCLQHSPHTLTLQKAFSPDILHLFYTLSQKKEPKLIPPTLPQPAPIPSLNTPIDPSTQEQQRRQELTQFFQKPSTVKKKRRL